MALYYTIADTKTIQVGDNLTGTHSNITITPINPDTDVHSGYYLQADNFKVGGGEESNGSGVAATGTNIYENITDTWNVDTGVTKVTFTNNSNTPGDINNTVNVRVDFGSITPSATGNINVDIDEKTDNPIQLTPSRKVCFQVWLLYDTDVVYKFYQPSSNVDEWTLAANPYLGVTRTQTDDGTTDGWIKYKFEGTINNYIESQSYELIRVGALRGNFDMAIDSMPSISTGPVEPNFSTHDFYFTNNQVMWNGTPPQYTTAYNHESFQVTNSNNQAYIIGTTLSYNPLDYNAFVELEQGDFCGLGHLFKIQQTTFDPDLPAEESDEITSVQFPSTLPSTSTHETITVSGNVGATYSLSFQAMESVTSIIPKTTNGHYVFSGGLRGFHNGVARSKSNEFTIGSSGVKRHNFILPRSTSEERYEVFITPTGTSSVKNGVPTKAGEGTIIREGITTITIQAEASTEADWQLTGSASESGVTPVRSAVFSRRKGARSGKHNSVSRRAKTAVSSSTRLVLDKADSRIQAGMYVITPMAGDGVPYNTTVNYVKDRVVVLSASCTIAQDAEVLFESNTSKVFPFNLTIPAGSTVGSEMITSDYVDNGTFTNDNGNWSTLDSSGGDVTFSRSAAKLEVTTTTDNEIEGAQLADDYMSSTVVGQVYRVSMDLQLTTPSSGTMSMQVGIGGGLSSAFDITTTETTYTKDIVATNTDGHLLIYNTSATASVFTVDNVSVKGLSYKNLTALTSASASYKPEEALGGNSTGFEITATNTSSSTTTVNVSEYNSSILTGLFLSGGSINVGGNNYVEITAGDLSAKSVTVASNIAVTSGDVFTVIENPDSTTALTTSGVDLIHVHAAISEAGSVNNQEVAQVYGYLRVNNPTNSATMPIRLDNILTSTGFS